MRRFRTARHLRFCSDLPRLGFLPHRLALWCGVCGRRRGFNVKHGCCQRLICAFDIKRIVDVKQRLCCVVLIGLPMRGPVSPDLVIPAATGAI